MSSCGRRIDVHATPLDDVERELTWPMMEYNRLGYRKYEVAAGRTLRVFRLTSK